MTQTELFLPDVVQKFPDVKCFKDMSYFSTITSLHLKFPKLISFSSCPSQVLRIILQYLFHDENSMLYIQKFTKELLETTGTVHKLRNARRKWLALCHFTYKNCPKIADFSFTYGL